MSPSGRFGWVVPNARWTLTPVRCSGSPTNCACCAERSATCTVTFDADPRSYVVSGIGINSESQYGQKIEDPWIPTAANQKYMDQSKIVRRCLTSSDAHCTSDYTPVPARTGGRPGQEAVAPAPAWAALGIRTRDCADSRLAAVLERRFGSATHLRLSGGGGQLLAPAADRQQALRLAHQVREDLGGGVWISVAWRPYEELVSGVCEMENVLTVVCALKRRPGSISSATWPWSARWRAARRCPGALRR